IPGEKLVTERNKKRLEKEKHEKGAQKTDCQKFFRGHKLTTRLTVDVLGNLSSTCPQ
ncbi:ASRGL1 isoform 10, partial [Pan troglodytes]